MPCFNNRGFCCLPVNNCRQPNRCCKPCRCCRPNCCCASPVPPPEEEGESLGVGFFFNAGNPNFLHTVGPGDLSVKPDSGGVPVADVTIPLNEFNPLLSMGADVGNHSLWIEKDGEYELSTYVGVQLASPAAYSICVAQIEDGVPEPVLTACARIPSGSILQPRLTQSTGNACLAAGTGLALIIRMESIGLLRVIPGAMLNARRLGGCII